MKIKKKTDKQTTSSSCQNKQSNKQHYCKSIFTQNNTVYSRTKEKAIPFWLVVGQMAFAGLKDTEMQKNIDVQSWGNFLLFQKKFKIIRLLKIVRKTKHATGSLFKKLCALKKKSFEKAGEYPTSSVWQHVFVLIRQHRFLCTLTEVKCNHVEHTSHKNWYHSSPNSGEFSRWRESATFFTYK